MTDNEYRKTRKAAVDAPYLLGKDRHETVLHA